MFTCGFMDIDLRTWHLNLGFRKPLNCSMVLITVVIITLF
jgi:hypothetical protein